MKLRLLIAGLLTCLCFNCGPVRHQHREFNCPTLPIEFEKAVLVAINRDRAQRSLLALKRDTLLTAAALDRAAAFARSGRLDHAMNGGPAAFLRELGLRRQSFGENLARIVDPGETYLALLTFWMARSPEVDNIRSVRFQHVGVGVARGADGCYCVLLLTD